MYEQLHGSILAIYLFSFGSYTLHISLCNTPPSQPPRTHTLELCCCSCDSAKCISRNPLASGPIRFCQRDAIEGNWKWHTGGRVFIPVFQLLSQYFSCRQLSLATRFFCTQQQLCYTSETPAADQRTVRPCSLTLTAIAFLRRPSTRYVQGASPQRSEYWPVKSGPFSELLVSGNHFPSSLLSSQALGHDLISPVLL